MSKVGAEHYSLEPASKKMAEFRELLTVPSVFPLIDWVLLLCTVTFCQLVPID
jgi:hypothetical protein